MHRTTLGDFELTILSDGIYHIDGGAMFGIIPKVMWEKRIPADEHNNIPMGTNSVLIRTGRENVLIETGIGNKLSEKRQAIYRHQPHLMKSFEEAGVSPDDIDIVINTHLHFDHCGWNTVRNSNGKIVPTFPRAKYYAPEGEWQYARRPSERDSISYISDNYDPLVASGQMTLLKGGEEIVPGISVQTFPGHTANMQAVIVQAPGENPHISQRTRDMGYPTAACYISDLIPTTAHIDLTWGMSFDLYPLQTIESKRHYYAKSIPEKWLTVFTHDPKTPWAYVEKDESGKMVARKS